MAKKNLTPADVVALLTSVAIEGWSMEHGVGYVDSDGELWQKDGDAPITTAFATLQKTVGDLHVTIALNARPCSTEKFSKKWDSGVLVEGHTIYNGRTFTRRGIDVSSCSLRDVADSEHVYDNLPALLAGEWQRCEASHAKGKTMVDVPGLPGGWKVTPERKAQLSADLQARKRATFTPRGMGIGYEIVTTAGRFATRLPKETADFFGVTWPLYYTTLDCD
jgi:hypothetical protein